MDIEVREKFENLKDETKARLKKKGGKKIVSSVRVKHAGEDAMNVFILEDGKKIVEDDKGKKTRLDLEAKKLKKIRKNRKKLAESGNENG